jgi:hypothetical protein
VTMSRKRENRDLTLRGARVGVILSGGNVDFGQVSAWLAAM